MFHSQGKISSIDTSVLLNSFVGTPTLATRDQAPTLIPRQDTSRPPSIPWPRKRLEQLFLKGHFDLQLTPPQSEAPLPTHFFTFHIPTLIHLEIQASSNTPVDLHLILDSALRLKHLAIHSHGSFLDSQGSPSSLTTTVATSGPDNRNTHQCLQSLKIQYLKINQQQLAEIGSRCPNLIEFQSLSSPGNIWKQRPDPVAHLAQPSSQQQQHPQQQEQPRQQAEMSLVRKLAQSCPRLTKLHVGHQQGGFHLDSISEAITLFPSLTSFGLPALDCSKTTMDTIKGIQQRWYASCLGQRSSIRRSTNFLTKLTIMNVSSSERISQAIHDYLCWSPFLREFYAYNTTLYLEQMQSGAVAPGPVVVVANHDVHDHQQDQQRIGFEPMGSSTDPSSNNHTIRSHESTSTSVPEPTSPAMQTTPQYPHQQQSQQQQQGARYWACTNLEILVVRFARAPWRNLSEPPQRSKDTFGFLSRLQRLQRLCIKEGLMLEAGREYDALKELRALEQVVFTTCYPIPIKPADMRAWIEQEGENGLGNGALKRVVIRRQKQNPGPDQEMEAWFQEQHPQLKFSFEVTDCCEEEFSF
ncbi:hypothetical protein BGZ82_000834 [Podila clonocystis]|nr:hypothetical protein BGZ82_000834 [Podila clonocystis]